MRDRQEPPNGRPRHPARQEARREHDPCAEPPDQPCEPEWDQGCEPRPIRQITQTVWCFDREDGRDHGGEGSDACGGGSSGRGGRPTRPSGNQNGRLGDGRPLGPGDLKNPAPPKVWVGSRADMDLPYLFMRANPADLGRRPILDAPFWESPDIFILPTVTPAQAPDIPASFGGVGQAGAPNTLYAHVWNFGKAAANEVIVEFYWVNPSLGIDAETVQLIAQTETSLGARGSGANHRVVKCPEPWVPTYVNGGHECLLVRVWDNPADLPGEPKFDAGSNRHVAQRNIHVNAPGMPTMTRRSRSIRVGQLGGATIGLHQPLMINVGRLYGVGAELTVERSVPSAVPWLQLHTGRRGVFPQMAVPTGTFAISPATRIGSGPPPAGGATTQTVHGDDAQVAFTTTDAMPDPGQAHVYRVSARQNGRVFGGYTVVLLGEHR